MRQNRANANYFENVRQHGVQLGAADTPEHFVQHALAIPHVSGDRPQILAQIQHAAVRVVAGDLLACPVPILARLAVRLVRPLGGSIFVCGGGGGLAFLGGLLPLGQPPLTYFAGGRGAGRAVCGRVRGLGASALVSLRFGWRHLNTILGLVGKL